MAPNPIDFDKVFTEFDRLPDSGNVAVIIAVSCVFGLYLLLLVWARKADMQDALKVDIVFLRVMNVQWNLVNTVTKRPEKMWPYLWGSLNLRMTD